MSNRRRFGGTVLRIASAALALLLIIQAVAHAQPASVLVAGIAADSAGVPMKDAELLIPELRRRSQANWLGEASIPHVPRGVYTVRVRALGYAPVELPVVFQHDTESIVIFLHRAATGLDTVRVTAATIPQRLQDFEQRRALGLGRFLTGQQLDSAGTEDFQTLMRIRFPGLHIAALDDGTRFLASTRGACGGDVVSSSGHGALSGGASCLQLQPCRVPILLDGMDVLTDVDLLQTWDLAGVEYYTPSQVPARYRRSGTACGLVLAWSR